MIIKLLFYALLLIWPSVLLSSSKIDKYNFSIQFSNLSIAKISATVKKNENKILYSIVSSSDGSLKSFYKFSSTIKGQSKRIRDKLIEHEKKISDSKNEVQEMISKASDDAEKIKAKGKRRIIDLLNSKLCLFALS